MTEEYKIKLNKFFILLLMISILLSVSVSFAADENATDLALNAQKGDIVDVSNQNEIVDTSNEVAVSADYSVDSNDSSSSIIPGKVVKRYNGAVEYSATFLDGEGKPLQNTVVYCGLDSVLLGVNATTDSNGVALFLLPGKKGVHTLYLVNTVTPGIVSDNITVFDVLSGNKNYNLYFNSGKYYTVKVYGNDGKLVGANKKVTFTVNLKKHIVKTDKKGNAKLKINFQPGSYLVTAQYGNFLVANKIIVKPILIPMTQFGAKKIGKTFKFKVKLLNNKGKAFKNKKVKVKFNKKNYLAKTNKKGIATFTLKTPTKMGSYKLVSSYGKAKVTSLFQRYYIR